MSLLAQCGYGKGDKVNLGVDASTLDGAILSPRDESPDKLLATAEALATKGANRILFDPQFYAAPLQSPRDGKLPDYEFYARNSGLSRSQFGPREIARYVREVLEFESQFLGAHLTSLISPTIAFEDFRDSWSQVAISMAQASLEWVDNNSVRTPLLLSFVFSESALKNTQAVYEFLDIASTLDAAGFYFIVTSSSGNISDPHALSNLMQISYVLGHLNSYDVVFGYADWQGLPLVAAGASSFATGWYSNLRHFSLMRYQPASGGRRPRKRYSSPQLLANILIRPEMQDIANSGLLSRILAGSPHDPILTRNPTRGEAQWTDEISCLEHWYSLNSLLPQITNGTVAQRLNNLDSTINHAITQHGILSRVPIVFGPTPNDHLKTTWKEAIQGFRRTVGI